MVRDDVQWNSMQAENMINSRWVSSLMRCGKFGESHKLQCFGEPVHDSEDGGVTLRRSQSSSEVKCDV